MAEILFDAFKNLYRRSFRTLLAILGVSAGIFSFLVMGSMAEHFHKVTRHFSGLFENRVFVVEKPTFWAGGGILSQFKEEKVRKILGVKETIPLLIMRYRTKKMVVIGLPRVVVGVNPDKLSYITSGFKSLKGKKDISCFGTALLGNDIARELNMKVGSILEIEGQKVKIVGILQKTGNLLDGQIITSLKNAQKIFNRDKIITSILVVPQKNVNAEKLALSIGENVKGIKVIPPSKFKSQIKSSLVLWNALTMGAALVASFAGALSVIIVMLVSVSERFVEIGIKKAIGASTGAIMTEILTESIIVSIFGWIVGLLLASIFIKLVGQWMITQGANLFDLTIRIVIWSFLGSLFLGILSGFYPAYKASTIKSAEALKVRY